MGEHSTLDDQATHSSTSSILRIGTSHISVEVPASFACRYTHIRIPNHDQVAFRSHEPVQPHSQGEAGALVERFLERESE